ncbi:MAG TPA: hypothetical protein VGN17_00295 [Bryobacteraceae bacterium]|jgi:hypothetical protein
MVRLTIMDETLEQMNRKIAALTPYLPPSLHDRADLAMLSERSMPVVKPFSQVAAENVQSAVRNLIRSMQNNLKEDEELIAYHGTGMERIQVMQVAYPNDHVIFLHGRDEAGNHASAIVSIGALNLTTRIVKVVAPQKPNRIGFSDQP